MSALHAWADRWAEAALLVTWLLAFFAALALLGERILRLRSAQVRHALWWFVLLAPLVIAPVRLGLARVQAMVPMPVPAAAVRLVSAVSPAPVVGAMTEPSPTPPSTPWWQDLGVTDVAALLWVLGLAALAVRLFVSHRRAGRVLRASVPVAEAEVGAEFATLCREAGLRRAAALQHSGAVGAPALYGWRRPVVLLPDGLLDSLDGEQVRAVLAHEVAHLRRRDFAANLLQRLSEAALFFHPAAWVAGRRITLAREELCDAWALSRGISAAAYAHSLAEAVAHAHLRPALALVSLAEEKSSLRKRVEAIMGGERGRLSRRMVVALVAVGLCVAAAVAVVEVRGTEHPDMATRLHLLPDYNERPGPREKVEVSNGAELSAEEAKSALQQLGSKVVKLTYNVPFQHSVGIMVDHFEGGKLVHGDLGHAGLGGIAGDYSLLFFTQEKDDTVTFSYSATWHSPDGGSTGSVGPTAIRLDPSLVLRHSGQMPVGYLETGKKALFWYFVADRVDNKTANADPPRSIYDVPALVAQHDLVLVAYVQITRSPESEQSAPDKEAVTVVPSSPTLNAGEAELALGQLGLRTYKLTYSLPFRHYVDVTIEQYEHGRLVRTIPICDTDGLTAGEWTLLLFVQRKRDQLSFSTGVRGKDSSSTSGPDGEAVSLRGLSEQGSGVNPAPVESRRLRVGKKTPFWYYRAGHATNWSFRVPSTEEDFSQFVDQSELALVAFVTIGPARHAARAHASIVETAHPATKYPSKAR